MCGIICICCSTVVELKFESFDILHVKDVGCISFIYSVFVTYIYIYLIYIYIYTI